MNKDTYIEMCEMLGQEVDEALLPYEIEDFPIDVQQALEVYKLMKDEWDAMSGQYLGKSLIGIRDLLDALEIPKDEHTMMIKLIRQFDLVRTDIINQKSPEKPAS